MRLGTTFCKKCEYENHELHAEKDETKGGAFGTEDSFFCAGEEQGYNFGMNCKQEYADKYYKKGFEAGQEDMRKKVLEWAEEAEEYVKKAIKLRDKTKDDNM